MYGDNPAPPTKKWQNLTTHKVGVLLRKLSDDEDQDKTSDIGDISSNPHTPWHGDFHGYLNSKDQLGAMTIVEWWGVCIQNSCPTRMLICCGHSGMHLDTLSGHLLPGTIFLLWHHRSQVSTRSHLQESPSANAVANSRRISLKLCSS